MQIRLLVLAIVVAAGSLIAGVKILHHSSPKMISELGTEATVDISEAPGPQSEAALAVDPTMASLLVGGSNDIGTRAMRVYQSVDGGRRWRSARLPGPPGKALCEASDPSIAISETGREYFAFLGIQCLGGQLRSSSIFVSTRKNATDSWHTLPLPVSRGKRTTLADDRPSITVDNAASSSHRGRLYVGWSRFSFDLSSIWADPDQQDVQFIDVAALISHSDDQGRHWSRPTVLSEQGEPLEVRLAVARDGVVYAVWRDAATDAIYVARSSDGTSFDKQRLVAAAVVPPTHSCHTARARIPAQPRRCVSPNPVVGVDASTGPRSGTVYVVWGSTGLNQSQDVDVAAFDPDLKPLLGVGRIHQVNPPEDFPGPDQFLPTAAVDPANGRVWACYYQTLSSHSAKARFTCTASDDGAKTWLRPVAVATEPSNETHRPANVENGYGDYEATTVAGGSLHAAWTDGRLLRSHNREEIYTARVGVRRQQATR
jgi:hypothetical protein